MKYLLLLPVLGDTPEIEIDESTYLAYKDAKEVLLNCLAIEKKYEMLLLNYLELEQQGWQIASSRMIRGFPDSFFEDRLMLDLRLANLLTTARIYLDQLPGHVRECLPHQCNTVSTVKTLCAAEYDSKWEYRFMEALRNHVQHHGLPVHFISSTLRRTEPGEDGLTEYSLKFASQKSKLKKNGKFKQQVLDEISDEVDLKLVTRCYVESLSNVHIEIRKHIAESVDQARQRIEDAFCQYREVYEERLIWLEAQKVDGSEVTEKVSLLLSNDDIRIQLQRRNSRLSNLQRSFATSQ